MLVWYCGRGMDCWLMWMVGKYGCPPAYGYRIQVLLINEPQPPNNIALRSQASNANCSTTAAVDFLWAAAAAAIKHDSGISIDNSAPDMFANTSNHNSNGSEAADVVAAAPSPKAKFHSILLCLLRGNSIGSSGDDNGSSCSGVNVSKHHTSNNNGNRGTSGHEWTEGYESWKISSYQ